MNQNDTIAAQAEDEKALARQGVPLEGSGIDESDTVADPVTVVIEEDKV